MHKSFNGKPLALAGLLFILFSLITAVAASAEDFTIIVLPDTQDYSGSYPAIFSAQTQWIIDSKDDLNIVYVAHEGDIVDIASSETQWENADAAMSLLEDPTTTGLDEGIPYGVIPGNHDQPTTSPGYYNTYFGVSRFSGKSYYGGSFDSDNDDNYTLFSGGGMDFIAINLNYDTSPDSDILNWANGLLQTHGDRRAIVVSHYMLSTDGSFAWPGQAIYDALKYNPNLFLMLCGHVHGEAMREEEYDGNTVHILLADYQDLPSGGNGWLRIMEFSPTNGEITVKTYSPTLDQYGADTIMGDNTTSQEFTISYNPGNYAPIVDAGPGQTVSLHDGSVFLDATVTDDGLPDPPGVVSITWSQVSGPGTVNFVDAGAEDTTVTFFEPGTYVLQITADDGELTASDEVTVVVIEEGEEGEVVTVEVRVAAGSDDAEESASGGMYLTSTDLELVYDSYDSAGDQTVGMRFSGVSIPQGVTIVNAYIQFQVDETGSEATHLTIEGEDTNDASPFTYSDGDISFRTRTPADVSWSPAAWATVGQAGPDQRTPDISSVIQEIVARTGWSPGNSLVVIITGTGLRVAESYDGAPGGAPLLHVEYSTGPVVNEAPMVDAGADQTITLPDNSVILDATVTDDGLPDPPGVVSTTWSQVSGPGMVTFADENSEDTTATFLEAGMYVLKLEADDGELKAGDEVTIIVNVDCLADADCDDGLYCNGAETCVSGTCQAGSDPCPGQLCDEDSNECVEEGEVVTVEVRVAAGSDDAEESASGGMYLTSSDLELVYDSYDSAGDQTVGIRFSGVDIPQGATIVNAYVQFQVDETGSEAAYLTIEGEDTNDASPFTYSDGDISFRTRTPADVSWSPVAWATVGQAGPDQRTPDISPVIQEIVARTGWSPGNSLVAIITGTGRRVAESYDGAPGGAALLHVEYSTGPVVNEAPMVDAGADQTITLPDNSVILDGTVTDDGLPDPPGVVSTTWSQVSGPGTVDFADAGEEDTTATFLQAGAYVLKLEANDGELLASDEVTIIVNVECLFDADCDDGLYCNGAEACVEGTCQVGPAVDCADGVSCTADSCNEDTNSCDNIPNNLTCDDGNGCTDDVCDAQAGCLNTWLCAQDHCIEDTCVDCISGAECDDGLYCNGAETCDNGTCAEGSDPCPAQLCVEDSDSCLDCLVDADCDDGLYCNGAETCSEGSCQAGPAIDCADGLSCTADSCNEDTNSCESVPNNSACDDGNGCTDDVCDAQAGCLNTWLCDQDHCIEDTCVDCISGAECDDGFYCNGAESCVSGTCQGGSDPCPGQVCDEDRNACVEEGEVVTLEVRVAASSDDAEESASGSIYLTSTDLELVYDSYDSAGNQTVGIRFSGVDIPQGATIVNAYIQFQVDEARSEATDLTIEGEDTNDASPFTSAGGDISARMRTPADVSWSPAAWSTVGQAGPDQRTPDISPVIQEIVARIDWSAGNSLVVIITGTGRRVAESYDGAPGGAPLLHVEYRTVPVVNEAPMVDAGADQTITLPDNSVILDGTVTDDGLPDPPGVVGITWSQVGGPGMVDFADAGEEDTTASFLQAGTYVLKLEANDGELKTSDEVTIIVNVDCLVDADCDDGLYCNGEETCISGTCQAGSDPCSGQVCDEDSDSCLDCVVDADCDDGLYCNGAEACVGGTCQAGTAVDCADGLICTADSCNEDTNSCDSVPNNSACDDGNGCTDDLCDAQAGCLNTWLCAQDHCIEDTCVDCISGAECDDGLYCNGAESCVSGTCQGGSDPCPGQACDEDRNACVEEGEVITVEVRVAASSDDAEESASGSIYLTSTDLELVYDSYNSAGNQTVGIRFGGVDIPQGATIVNAYIQFQVDEARSEATDLTIEGEDTNDASPFTSSSVDISSRTRTPADVSWSPAAWATVGQAGPDQRTPDISSVIQEIVDRIDWSPGNSLVVIITGTGRRVAESYDGDPSGAPLLHVEYSTGPVVN